MVDLGPPDPQTRALWLEALDLMDQFEGDWTLVGGLMVQLHAARHGAPGTRPTVDIDILGDSRKRPSVTTRVAQKLLDLGFEIAEQLVDPPTAFRFQRGNAIVDVLGPDGTKTAPTTVGNLQTIKVSGGTQALKRTETVRVRLDDSEVEVRCPTLLGAILLKARGIRKKQRDQDRQDLVLLLSCVDEPLVMSAKLKTTERAWLRAARDRLALDSSDLPALFTDEQLARARATYDLLTK